jgi:hypothetical protein
VDRRHVLGDDVDDITGVQPGEQLAQRLDAAG